MSMSSQSETSVKGQRLPIRPEFLFTLIAVHLMALAAPFTYTVEGLIAFGILYFVSGCLGVTLCYHRLLTHRSFKTPKLVRNFLMVCGCLAFEGDPAWWVATHRQHHMESDKPRDPHSPRDGFMWSHMGWLVFENPNMKDTKHRSRLIPDLEKDPWAQFLARHFLTINVLFFIGLFVLGYALGGLKTGLSMFIWGGFLRVVAVWHVTWLVNSATHVWGYRNYESRDDSRNNWWVALLTFGEGWHNNHHAQPSAAKSGHRWWEVDLTYGIIVAMRMLGLAWRIHPVVTSPAVVKPLSPTPDVAQRPSSDKTPAQLR